MPTSGYMFFHLEGLPVTNDCNVGYRTNATRLNRTTTLYWEGTTRRPMPIHNVRANLVQSFRGLPGCARTRLLQRRRREERARAKYTRRRP